MAAGDAYTATYGKVKIGFERMECCMDNTILWDDSLEINFDRVCKYLTQCARNRIAFNEKKFSFVRKEVEYLGFTLTDDSVKPTPDMLNSITELPKPKDLRGAELARPRQPGWPLPRRPLHHGTTPRPCRFKGQLPVEQGAHHCLQGQQTTNHRGGEEGITFFSPRRKPSSPPTGARLRWGSTCFKSWASARR